MNHLKTDDSIDRLFARLQGLHKNLPDTGRVHDGYVEEYHSIIDGLEQSTDSSLTDFRVPADQVRPLPNMKQARRVCDRGILMAKIDALLTYFQPTDSKPPIGFHPPREKTRPGI